MFIDENQLEYHLYIFNQNEDNIEDFYKQLTSFIDKLSENYIWNNEKFVLNRPKSETLIQQNNSEYVSEGIIDFKDNVDDEWFIVYLFMQLTFNFKNQITCQLQDSDGEFLLIYLANHLPKWASNSIVMKNRVFLFNGELHLIPPATNPSQITYLPANGAIKEGRQAGKIVFDFSDITRASEILQKNLNQKIEMFKNYEKIYLHHSTCTIPAKLAWMLSFSDNSRLLMSNAINRFCEKDPNDLKLIRTLNTFKAEDLIDYRVTFTKFLYSKLKYCEFNADKRHNWPKISDTTVKKDRLGLGFKLTCAFELMKRIEEQSADDLNQKDKNFKSYVDNLDNLGYFKGLLKDSQEYKSLFENAKLNYSASNEFSSSFKIGECLKNMPNDYVSKLNDEILLKNNLIDDNDSWLKIDLDDKNFDDYLEMYSNGNVSSTYDFKLISDAFNKFLDLNQPKLNKNSEGPNVDFKNINACDEELIDFNVNLIEANINEFLSLNKNDNDEEESDNESDSFYEINKSELNDGEEDEDLENKNLKEVRARLFYRKISKF